MAPVLPRIRTRTPEGRSEQVVMRTMSGPLQSPSTGIPSRSRAVSCIPFSSMPMVADMLTSLIVVEDVHPASRRDDWNRVRRLALAGSFRIHWNTPTRTTIGADCEYDVLSTCSLSSKASGHHTHPMSFLVANEVGLMIMVLAWHDAPMQYVPLILSYHVLLCCTSHVSRLRNVQLHLLYLYVLPRCKHSSRCNSDLYFVLPLL